MKSLKEELQSKFEKETGLSAIIGKVKGQWLYHSKYTEWLEIKYNSAMEENETN